ncbi:MAG: hypothetical protein R2712_08405 [Vicinamibacterales bacterium]
MRRSLAIVLLLVAATASTHTWGVRAHDLINRVAVGRCPTTARCS